MPPLPAASRSRRRIDRLVRVALGLVLIVGLGCGGSPKPTDLEQEALAALDVYSPVTELDDKGRVVDLKLEGKAIDAEALDHVVQLSELRRLSLYRSAVTDGTLWKLTALKRLEALGLGGTPISDAGIGSLEKMPSLRWVWLSKEGKVTPQRVEKLKKTLPGLTVFWQ